MRSLRTSFIAAALLATMASISYAQTATAPAPQTGSRPHMGAFMEKRMDQLKEKLKLTASQQGNWDSFSAAMKPPSTRPSMPSREEIAQLSAPERIDRMNAMRAQHEAEMDKRSAAVKTFYATLTPEQQKMFDKSFTLPHPGGMMHHPGGGAPKN